jgi:hypothetical protein
MGRILFAVGLGVVLTQWHDTITGHLPFWNIVSILGVGAVFVGLVVLEPWGSRWERREADRAAEKRHREVLAGFDRVIESVGPTVAQGVDYASASVGITGAHMSAASNRVFYVPNRAAQDSALAVDRAGEGASAPRIPEGPDERGTG